MRSDLQCDFLTNKRCHNSRSCIIYFNYPSKFKHSWQLWAFRRNINRGMTKGLSLARQKSEFGGFFQVEQCEVGKKSVDKHFEFVSWVRRAPFFGRTPLCLSLLKQSVYSSLHSSRLWLTWIILNDHDELIRESNARQKQTLHNLVFFCILWQFIGWK